MSVSRREECSMKRIVAVLSAMFLCVVTLTSCNKSQAPQQAQQGGGPTPAEERVEKNPDRNAYFGEEHIHTSWSLDAWVMGNRITGPDEAVKYAQGQTIKHTLEVALR